MSFSSDIDYLFEDLHDDTTVASQVTEVSPSTAFPFEELSGELRNSIYEYYFNITRTTALSCLDGSENLIIKIDGHGELSFPSSLAQASRQVRLECQGYIYSALVSPTVAIHAQIRDYDAQPLHRTLQKISSELKIPAADLVTRVKVFFIGDLNLGNLLSWIQGNINNVEAAPFFDHQCASPDGYGAISIFQGTTSLRTFVQQYKAFEAHAHVSTTWRNLAFQFLSNVEDLGVNTPAGLRNASDETLSLCVFEMVAKFHHMIMNDAVKLNGKTARSKTGQSAVLFGLVELMFNFEEEARVELVRRGFW